MDKAVYGRILKNCPREVSSGRLWVHLAIDIFIFIGMAGLAFSSLGIWSSIPTGLLFAVFTFRSFGIMHDAVHSAAHPKRSINRWVGEIYGICSLLPFGSWRALHLDHHKWTGNVERDPAMKILVNFAKSGYKMPGVVRFSWKNWVPLLGFMQHLVFWKATRAQKEYTFLAGAPLYLVGVGALLGPSSLVFGLVTYLYFVEVINFPHHLGLIQNGGDARFLNSEQLPFARSCIYPKWFAHLVLLNFNLHSEHHLFPSHPWYQLDQIRNELAEAKVRLNTSEGNSWILLNRRRPIEAVFIETFEARASKQNSVA